MDLQLTWEKGHPRDPQPSQEQGHPTASQPAGAPHEPPTCPGAGAPHGSQLAWSLRAPPSTSGQHCIGLAFTSLLEKQNKKNPKLNQKFLSGHPQAPPGPHPGQLSLAVGCMGWGCRRGVVASSDPPRARVLMLFGWCRGGCPLCTHVLGAGGHTHTTLWLRGGTHSNPLRGCWVGSMHARGACPAVGAPACRDTRVRAGTRACRGGLLHTPGRGGTPGCTRLEGHVHTYTYACAHGDICIRGCSPRRRRVHALKRGNVCVYIYI